MKEIYEIIRELREDHDQSQKHIAKILNTSQSNYSKYERGERRIIANDIKVLALHYNTSADYILGLIDIPRAISRSENK